MAKISLSFENNETFHNFSQLFSQPAARRTVGFIRPGSGFTIVELLIVIVVIGILAAIVIVAYNGIQNRANDSAVQSDLSAMAKKFEVAKVTGSGTYPFPLTTSIDIHITKNAYRTNQNNLYYCYDSVADKYALQVRSTSGNYFKIFDGVVSSGAYTGTNGFSGQGTCDMLAASITWGGSTSSLGYTNPGTWASWAQ